MNKDEDNLCTTDLNSIAEFNRIILNYKKMNKLIDNFCENSARLHNEKLIKELKEKDKNTL